MAQVSKLFPRTPKQAACCSSELDTLLDPELFKALGDPTRLKLLSCLARCSRECSTTEIAQCCSIDFSVVTRHLATLSRAGIVNARKEGRTVYYQVRYSDLSKSLMLLANAFAGCCSVSKRQNSKRQNSKVNQNTTLTL